ncbi:family 78 glycoside hydrolase catalytic domain [Pararhodonellum marinum]|uniref:family 78 glycoside hydrolase catalytic domain n=1 Tax=Pararhodonellum marinum TaxID=2755358 RepID=UPI00188E455B|nr:family 78 glycoside hydrolase catalytic domain [Pararhodonellum marinum]
MTYPKLLIAPLLILALFSCQKSQQIELKNLKTEYLENPLALDTDTPRFSWEIESSERGIYQSAYQIQVHTEHENEEALWWDSGKKMETENIQIQYSGPKLEKGIRYFWKVKIWDQEDKASGFSEDAFLEMGLREGDWEAAWIGDGRPMPEKREDFYEEMPSPYFRKTFALDKGIKEAKLYITGLGYYEAFLNGERIGDQVLDPGWTNYSKRVLYSTYDVTDHLKSGNNALAVHLGNGWYNPLPLGLFRRFNLREFLAIGAPQLIAQMEITFEDGTQAKIFSDGTWKWAESPLLKNSVYLGEVYDARRNLKGWEDPDYDDSNWQEVKMMEGPGGKLEAQMAPPIRHTKTLTPTQITSPEPGIFVVDMGQNFAGWLRLKNLKGESGTEVKMHFGELLFENGRVNGNTTVAGHIKEVWNLSGGPGAPKTAYQEDTYIMNGEGSENYQQTFTFRAYRYVEISGYPGTLTADQIEGIVLNSDLEKAGDFQSSNELFNQVQDVTLWTMLSNVFSIQSDCPGREKFGYGGDIVTAAEAYLYNFDMAQFYTKTVKDFRDDQRPNGGMPETAPYNGIDSEGMGEGSGPIGWQLAYPFVQYQLYLFYGDKAVLEDHYPATKKMVDFMISYAEENGDGLVRHGLSDHVALDPKPVELTSAAFYYHNVKLFADFAKILNKEADAKKYGDEAERIKAQINEEFLREDSGQFTEEPSQITQTFGLWYDFPPSQDLRDKAKSVLVSEVMDRHKGHISTGIFGTKMIYDVLRREDLQEVAYTMLNQREYPSYGFMLESGATTLWEHWKEDLNNSHNHPMFGSVSEWYFRSLGGINPDEAAPGFKRFILKPYIDKDESAKVSYYSIRGEILSEWENAENAFNWTIKVPGNTTAEVHLPRHLYDRFEEGNTALDKAHGIKIISDQQDKLVLELGSGVYDFKGIKE